MNKLIVCDQCGSKEVEILATFVKFDNKMSSTIYLCKPCREKLTNAMQMLDKRSNKNDK